MFVNNGDELPVSTKQVIECLKAPQASLLLSSPFLPGTCCSPAKPPLPNAAGDRHQ